MLRAQADRGLTVLASIHQPAERLLARFDELLLTAGGLLVYQGGSGEVGRLHQRGARWGRAVGEMDVLDGDGNGG